MNQRHFYPAYIIQVFCYKGTVISSGGSKSNHGQRPEIEKAEDACEFQEVDEDRVI